MANKTEVTAEPGKQELFITREFDAPRELVFRAHTEPDLYVQWIGACGMSMKIDKFAHAAGQPWRDIFTDANGNSVGFNGVCHYVDAPSTIIRTFEFEGLPERGHVSLETAQFEELPGGRSRIRIQSVFKSVADRDGMVQSGMEMGINAGHAQLDSLLEQLKGQAAHN